MLPPFNGQYKIRKSWLTLGLQYFKSVREVNKRNEVKELKINRKHNESRNISLKLSCIMKSKLKPFLSDLK